MLVRGAGFSDVGRRSNNEDCLLVDDEHGIYAVADGMGGRASGEIASSLALAVTPQRLLERLQTFDLQAPDLGPKLLTAVRQAMLAACSAVHARAENRPDEKGMGTTLTLLVVVGRRAVMGHVGDSRLYLQRDDMPLQQLSSDHNVPGELYRVGIIDSTMAALHPQRHVLTRSVGPEPEVDVDTCLLSLSPGDRLLLCTDGVSNLPDPVGWGLTADVSPAAMAEQVVEQAVAADGSDNTTAVVIHVSSDDRQSGVDWRLEPTWEDEPTLVTA